MTDNTQQPVGAPRFRMVDESILLALLDYLSKRPWKDVSNFIGVLQQSPQVMPQVAPNEESEKIKQDQPKDPAKKAA